MKIGQYRKRGIEVPPNVTLIPINFEKESVAERLAAGGFRADGKTLVILEGVLQYLAPEAAHATIDTVRGLAGAGSWLVFDYAHASAVRAEGGPSEETRMMKGLSRYGESWQFGLEEAEVEPFLRGHGFRMVDRKGPKELGESYFRTADGVVRAQVNGTQSIVKAERL
jgi:methyltransferase (TIGR00027 family)